MPSDPSTSDAEALEPERGTRDVEPLDEAVPLAEKVRFWQEQDRINRALIPRVLALHDRLVQLGRTLEGASERLASVEAEVDAVREALDRTAAASDLETTTTALEAHRDREAELRNRIETLEHDLRRNRLLGLAALLLALVAGVLAWLV